jgi:hypothetical protein
LSKCVRAACSNPEITYAEWDRNDGACDACADMRPSEYFSSRSNDEFQQKATIEADAKWLAQQEAA